MTEFVTVHRSVQRSWFKRAGYSAIRVLARLVGLLVFRIRVEGRERFPRDGGGLVCANHQSFLDPALVGICTNRRMNYLARETLFRYPGLRELIQFLDAVPINREGMGIGGLKETLRRLKRGELILIFPEGTRSPDGRLTPLKPGFVALVRRGKVPVIPVGIDGAYQAWPRTGFFPRPSRIHLAIGEPISVRLAASLSDDELVEELSRRLRDCMAHSGRRARAQARTRRSASRAVGK